MILQDMLNNNGKNDRTNVMEEITSVVSKLTTRELYKLRREINAVLDKKLESAEITIKELQNDQKINENLLTVDLDKVKEAFVATGVSE